MRISDWSSDVCSSDLIDVIVCTAAVPGRPAPKIISTAMVAGMKPGSVIVDLAAETGGNCELTQPGETIDSNGVTVAGPLDLASSGALHASEMYARNVFNLVSRSEEHTSELQSLMRISYAVFCLKKKTKTKQ